MCHKVDFFIHYEYFIGHLIFYKYFNVFTFCNSINNIFNFKTLIVIHHNKLIINSI